MFVCINGVSPGQKTIAYYKVCQFPENYEIIMFYNTGPCPICCFTTQGAKVIAATAAVIASLAMKAHLNAYANAT